MKPRSSEGYLPHLDGLRAIAFVAVAISHWTPDFLAGIVPWGTGVQLFYVLSGFLITGILLRGRPAETGLSIPQVLKVFYARRALRIFPLYYAVIALSAIFAVGPIRSMWPWHVSYLSNFHYAWRGHDGPLADPFLHLWSLSVEEQFYLVWPFVCLVASRRILPAIFVGSIIGAMACRVATPHVLSLQGSIRYLTPNCVDALAVGALAAYVQHYAGTAAVRRLGRTYAIVGIAGVASSFLLMRILRHDDAWSIGHTFLVIFYGALVVGAAQGFAGPLGSILALKPVRYLGRISYGLYVFHYFAPLVVSRVAPSLRWEAARQPTAFALVAYAAFTLIAAVASWHLYEAPLNRLKRHFPYPSPAIAPETRPAREAAVLS